MAGGRSFSSYRRRAITLLELVLSMGIFSILIAGMGSAMMVAARALPDADSPGQSALALADVEASLISELTYAKAINTATATEIEFAVVQSGDTCTIRYDWNGTPGAPLMRSKNGGTMTTVLTDVQSFALTYKTQSIDQPPPLIEGSEQLFLQQDSSNSGTESEASINNNAHVAQSFMPTLPADAVSWRITRIQAMLARDGAPNGNVRASVRQAALDGTPGATIDFTDIAESAMSALWDQLTFANAAGLNPALPASISFEGIGTDPAGLLKFGENSVSSPQTTYWEGPAWSQQTDQDVWISVWGTVTTQDPDFVPPNELVSVHVSIDTGGGPEAIGEATVVTLNRPEISP